MKLRYFIPSLIAAVTLLVSCSENDDPTLLSQLQVSSSYVAIDITGGSQSITLNANSDWAFVSQQWIAGKDTTNAASPAWLTISQTSGSAGETTLTFSAESTLDGRTAELLISCGGQTQYINVLQGLATVSEATCAEVIAGPDAKTYRVTGTCVRIANTSYGNWYLEDETGQIYIYGTVDATGNYNWSSFDIEVGDEVTVEGPKTTYNGTVELVDVQVISVNKSLIKVDSLSNTEALPVEGGDVTAFIACKGNGISVEIPEDAKDWLFISGTTANTVTFHALPNEGGDRETTVVFRTSDGKKDYTSQTVIAQKGAIIECSVADFNAAEVGNTQYRITGIISRIANAGYGNYYIRDYSGETYVYGTGAKGDFEALGLKEGDIVTVVGKRDQYKETIEMTGSVVEKINSVKKVTIAEFNAAPDAADVYYMITGNVTNIANATYGNLYLADETGETYVYGCYPGWGATGDFRKNLLETAGIEVGDKLTVIGSKTTYNGTIEVNGGIYFSHESKAE
ncbi:MAG: DNA-binding protein [Prevotella sp.]|nr:DNA-binding protein [Prevotella sp.]